MVMRNTNRTGKKAAKLAGKTLASKSATAEQRSLAGSALAQTRTDKTTSKPMETKASAALKNSTDATTQSLAGSVVSQSNKKP